VPSTQLTNKQDISTSCGWARIALIGQKCYSPITQDFDKTLTDNAVYSMLKDRHYK